MALSGAAITARLAQTILDVVQGRLSLPGLSQRLRDLADEVDASRGPQGVLPGVPGPETRDEATARKVERVFAYWQRRTQSVRASLTKERERVIRARLETYTEEDVIRAIEGGLSVEHMAEHRDLINLLRNDTRVEQFREKAPGRMPGASNGKAEQIARLEEEQQIALQEGRVKDANDAATRLRALRSADNR